MDRRRRVGEVFGRLRLRLTAMFFGVALVGFAVLVGVLAVRDAAQTGQWMDTLLRGEASRAAALIYVGEDGKVTTEALIDDHVSTQAHALLIVQRDGSGFTVLHARGHTPQVGWEDFALRCVADAPEEGTFTDFGGLRGAGMPWWRETEDPEPSGCAIALAPRRQALESEVILPSSLGSGVLLLLLSGIVWWAAGRGLGVAETALADRERFLATAAHELRGPLARMRAVAEAALRELPAASSETAPRLRSLVGTADTAGRVVSNLLLATRIDHAEVPVHLLPVRLDDLAMEVETVIDGVVVDVSEPVEVRGDAPLLRQAMTNLVDNALRHGHAGETHSEVLLTVERREGRAVIRVADDGPGFPPGVDVTEPYYSGPAGGNGLGLPLVRWIAERHGAELWTGSADGRDGLEGAAAEIRFGV